jgi:hypothetical protein
VTETWYQRDLPVLRAVVELADIKTGGPISNAEIASATGFDSETVRRALHSLLAEDPPFFEAMGSYADKADAVSRISGHAKRVAGAWPTPESLADAVRDAIVQAAAEEMQPEKRNFLETLGMFIAEGGRDVLTAVFAARFGTS